MRRIICLVLILISLCFTARSGYADCTSPAGKERDILYNNDYHTFQFCNGTGWLKYGGGSNCTAATGGYSPTAPSGTGYFVLTSTTYDGNLGGYIGADALCLTELTSNTGWLGYATANSNGQLISSKVHAFLSNPAGCGICAQNLMPLTTYYFANAGNGAAGGASFTTDANGYGPNDNANWSGATYFSATATYWSDRYGTASSAAWDGSNACNGGVVTCSSWTTNGAGTSGGVGNSAHTDGNRWITSTTACNNTLPLICVVNP